jgi:hypothetical protein
VRTLPVTPEGSVVASYYGLPGVVQSDDEGKSWVQLTNGLRQTEPRCLAAGGPGRIFAGLDTTLAVWQNDRWSLLPSGGFPQCGPSQIAVSDEGYVCSGTFEGIVRATQPVTDVADDSRSYPPAVSLEQNYPNPFIPTTVIGFQLPAALDVRIVIYDMLGCEVALVVNEKRGPGTHAVEFSAAGLASGVSLYRLTTGSAVQTRQMIVIK